MNLLERLHHYSRILHRFRVLILLVGALALFTGLFTALAPDGDNEGVFLIALILFCWCLLFYIMMNWFQARPPDIKAATGVMHRLRIRAKRLLLTLMAGLFVILSATLVFLSYRLLSSGIG